MDPLALRIAAKFHSPEELREYLKEHPDADRSQHKVMTPAEKTRDYKKNEKDAALVARVSARADKPSPDMISQAFKAGEAAHKAGLPPASARDPWMHKFLSENRGHPVGWTMPILEAWAKGWHKANLASPEE